MKINVVDGIAVVDLESNCTIVEVEEDTDKFLSVAESLVSMEVRTSAVQEMDTAYFQLILALQTLCRQNEIPFSISDKNEAIGEICTLYGADL